MGSCIVGSCDWNRLDPGKCAESVSSCSPLCLIQSPSLPAHPPHSPPFTPSSHPQASGRLSSLILTLRYINPLISPHWGLGELWYNIHYYIILFFGGAWKQPETDFLDGSAAETRHLTTVNHYRLGPHVKLGATKMDCQGREITARLRLWGTYGGEEETNIDSIGWCIMGQGFQHKQWT